MSEKEFNDSINKPHNWEFIRLGKYINSFAGGTPLRNKSEYFENGTIPWIKSGEVNNRQIRSSEEKITEKAIKETPAKLIKPNSILLALYGATAGNVGILKIEAASNQAVLAISSKKSCLYNEYIYHYLKSATPKLLSLTQGSGQPNLSKKIIDQLILPLPPLPEQQKIAEILSTVDEMIEVIEAQINQTTALKKGLMQQLLTKGIGHTRFKDSPLGKIPESWEVVKLDSLGKFSKGKGITKSQLSDDGFPCIRYGEIYTVHHYVVKDFYSFIPENIANESVLLEHNDLIFAGSGETIEDIGKCVAYVFNKKVFAGGDTIIFKPKNANSIFLSYYVNSEFGISQRRKMGQGNAVVHIYSRDLSNLIIVLPPKHEQDEISRIFLTVDEKLDSLTIKREYFNQMKKGLMQQLLTGKLRVNLDHNLIFKN